MSTPSDKTKYVDEDYTETLASSYLNYSMSVLVDRAVPDLRDGLKPVQRRVLYDMYRMGATHDKPYKKTARVSGDVIGRLHPHGSSGVETAIVTMAQPFKKPVTFVDGQGNWGSVEGDGAAAARYTECRLTEFSEECFLQFVNDNTVDFQSNYDETLQEPVVLPSLVPTVLITGAEGIAVGVRTNIPTFNLSEVIDANVYVLTHKNVSADGVRSVMPGPDFVSGGVVCNSSELSLLYETGECRIRVRGKVHYEPASKGSRPRLVIDEVPYTMIGSAVMSFIQSIVDLAESKQLPGVVDVVDQTAESVRVVLELSRDADPEFITNTLFAKTKLEDTFSANVLVVCEDGPRTVGVVELLERFAEFQKGVFVRKYRNDLSKYLSRQEVLQAYLVCSKNAKKIVDIVQSSKDTKEARASLTEKFGFTENQCDAVLALRISRLVSIEVEKVSKELESVGQVVNECESVLSDDSKLTSRIVSKLKSLKRKYGYDRRTELLEVPVTQAPEVPKEVKEVYVVADRFSYVHQVDKQTYDRYSDSSSTKYSIVCPAKDNEKVLFLASDGVEYTVKVSDIPRGSLKQKGAPLDTLTGGKFNSRSSTILCAVASSSAEGVLVVTSHGKCKIVTHKDLVVSRTAVSYCSVDSDEQVVYVGEVSDSDCSIGVFTSDNRYVKVSVSEVPKLSRSGKGRNIVQRKSPSVTVTFVGTCSSSDECFPLGSLGVKLTSSQIEEVRKLYH